MSLRLAVNASFAAALFEKQPAARLELLRAVWPAVAGAELARRTRLLAVDGAILRVRVPDASWRRVLHRLRWDVLSRLRLKVGKLAPRRLAFYEGGGAEINSLPPPQPQTGPPPAPPRLPKTVASAASAIADLELRRQFERTAALYLSARARAKITAPS